MTTKAADLSTAREITEEEAEELVNGEFEDGRTIKRQKGDDGKVDLEVIENIRHDVDTIILWDRRDASYSEVRLYDGNNTKAKMLAKVDANEDSPYYGLPVFTEYPPTKRPDLFYTLDHIKRPRVPCWFNPEHADYDANMALSALSRPCVVWLASEEDAEAHVENRHRRQFKMKTARVERELAAEDRLERKQMLQAMLKIAEKE